MKTAEDFVPEVGMRIVYVDEHRRKRPALVTHVGMPHQPRTTWVDVVFVNLDESQKDDYGRKLERRSSVPPYSEGWTGNYWTDK